MPSTLSHAEHERWTRVYLDRFDFAVMLLTAESGLWRAMRWGTRLRAGKGFGISLRSVMMEV